MAEFEVKLSGFQEIDSMEQDLVRSNCIKFCERNNRKLKNIEFIELRLKEHQKSGTRRKFSVHSCLGFSGTVLSSKAFDWKLINAIDSSLKKMEAEINKKFVGKIQSKSKSRARKMNRLLE
jgi:ribosome-associated translation inhibitor RaiA